MRLQTRAFVIAAALAVASPALAFDVTDTDGKRHRLADYRGKWVVVNFWATWCAPCLKEIPDFNAFAKSRPDVQFIGLAYEEIERADMEAFLDRLVRQRQHHGQRRGERRRRHSARAERDAGLHSHGYRDAGAQWFSGDPSVE